MAYTDDMGDTYASQLRELVALFGSQRRVATFAGLGHSQVSRWISGGRARESSVRQIADAAGVVDALRTRGLNGPAVVTAVNTIWPELDGARPTELVAAGRAADVLAAVDRRYSFAKQPNEPDAGPPLVDALLALAAAARASAAALSRESSA
jgi:hypothetical protein